MQQYRRQKTKHNRWHLELWCLFNKFSDWINSYNVSIFTSIPSIYDFEEIWGSSYSVLFFLVSSADSNLYTFKLTLHFRKGKRSAGKRLGLWGGCAIYGVLFTVKNLWTKSITCVEALLWWRNWPCHCHVMVRLFVLHCFSWTPQNRQAEFVSHCFH